MNHRKHLIRHKLQQQSGYMLLFTIFFMCCILLCGSALMLHLSDRFAASNETVQKEQSRLLAFSGWNLALEQLQLSGSADAITVESNMGDITVTMTPNEEQLSTVDVNADAMVGHYKQAVSGTVQYFPFPFQDTVTWPTAEEQSAQTEASILLVNGANYTLQTNSLYGLGITSTVYVPLQVDVAGAVTVDELYIYGDLTVAEDAVLNADCIYVSGDIYGTEQINCNALYSHYNDAIPYQIRVLKRQIG